MDLNTHTLMSVDGFLSHLRDKNNSLLRAFANENSVVSSLWGFHLPRDDDCQMNVSTKSGYGPSCLMCHVLSHLTSFKESAVNRPFLIECGREVGKELIIRSHNHVATSITSHSGKVILDPFSNYVITNLVLNELMPRQTLALRTAFICSGKGYTLIDHHQTFEQWLSELSTLSSLEERTDMVFFLLQQLVLILKKGQERCYVHGQPDLRYLYFEARPFKCTYQGCTIRAPFTLRLESSPSSSIVLEGKKIESLEGWRRWERQFFRHSQCVIRDETVHLYRYYASSPVPCAALDFYLFFLQLLQVPLLKEMMKQSQRLSDFCSRVLPFITGELSALDPFDALLYVEIEEDIIAKAWSALTQ